MIHIGQLIKQKVKESERKRDAIEEELDMVRSNLDNIFTRETIDTGLLLRISKALDYDFFRHYSATIPTAKCELPTPKNSLIYSISQHFEIFKENAEKCIGTFSAQEEEKEI